MVVIVDETLEGVADVIRYEKGRALAFITSLVSMVAGAVLGVGVTEATAVGAGILGMALACRGPRRPPFRSQPPLDPDSEMAAIESLVLNRIGATDERVDDMRADLDAFLSALEGGSNGVALAATGIRARLRRSVS